MIPKDPSLSGEAVPATGRASHKLTFPAHLVHPPQSQVAFYGDQVSQRIGQLDLAAQQFGAGFGISFTTFALNPLSIPSSDNNLAILASTLQALSHREERVTLERRAGHWGLFYTRTPALMSQERTIESVPLKDASLDVRERFLVKSEAFFREYLKLCEDRLGRMKTSVTAANRTLDLLAGIRLE